MFGKELSMIGYKAVTDGLLVTFSLPLPTLADTKKREQLCRNINGTDKGFVLMRNEPSADHHRIELRVTASQWQREGSKEAAVKAAEKFMRQQLSDIQK